MFTLKHEGRPWRGLRVLLKGDVWRERGLEGWGYVSETFETRRAIDRHLKAYEEVLEEGSGAGSRRSA